MTDKLTENKRRTPKARGKQSSRKGKSVATVMRHGTPLSIELFKRHGWFILIAMVVVVALTGQRYANANKVRKVQRLKKELALQQSVAINEKAAYMSLIRENVMRDFLHARHLDLDYQEQPPYSLSYE